MNDTQARGRHAGDSADGFDVTAPAIVEIARLREQLVEAHEWNTILTELLLRREEQIAGIKLALGDDATQEHPGVTRFRGLLNKEADAES